MLDGKENTHGITTSEKKTYTVDEIAVLLNISMKSAYALVKSGQFHYIRAGRMIRVDVYKRQAHGDNDFLTGAFYHLRHVPACELSP